MSRSTAVCACASMAAWSFLGGAASAAPFFLTASQGNLEASVAIAVDGGDPSLLVVTLTNSAMSDVLVPADVLTALFFDISTPVSLTPVSASLGMGSVVHFGPDGGGNVGGEWAYRDQLTGVMEDAMGTGHGISSAGFGLFGNANFGGPNLDDPLAVNGLNYGILSAGDNPATGNAAVIGGTPLIQNSVVFVLSGLPMGFDPSTSISGVLFQYGTDLDEPRFPTPGAGLLFGLGVVAATRRRR